MNDGTPLDRLVAEVARRESAGLLDEVVAAARQRVRDDLARRLADAMTAEILSTTDTPRAVPPSDGLYAYGLVRDHDIDLSIQGIGAEGGPVWTVTRDGLGIVVSGIRLDELAGLDGEQPVEDGRLAEFARGHDAVVRAAFDQGPILPLRFGTVLPDADAAAELLARQREDALAMLDRITGKREWGTKVLSTTKDAAPTAAPAASGTDYLLRKRDELAARNAAREQRRTTLDRVHGTLAERAAGDMRRTTVGEDVLLDSAFLVPEDATDDFLACVDRIADEIATEDLSLRATGPWPPYSFAVVGERVDG